MSTNVPTSRERILAKLRANPAPFDHVAARPDVYRPVTQIEGDPAALLTRFTAELERLTGKVYAASDPADAIQHVVTLLGEDRSVLTWESLPLPGLSEALAARGIQRIVPHARREERTTAYPTIEPVRVGITGADAALASTGTLALITTDTQGRVPSLLPAVHIAVVPRERLYPNLESWLAAAGRTAMIDSSSVALITGPSRTSDIEMQTIFGVHGPGKVHVIFF